jgi:hypothetical protein
LKQNNMWFFQSNPEHYAILEALSDPDYKIMTWEVNQFKNDVKKDDSVLIWVAGEGAGIYATALILNDPVISFEYPDDKYWIDKSKLETNALRVLLEINLLDRPILRTELKDKGLKTPPISKFYNATNFKIDNERQRILSLLKSKNKGLF